MALGLTGLLRLALKAMHEALAPPEPSPTPRDKALEALFAEVSRWCRRSDIEDLPSGLAEIMFNNEYPLRLPREAMALLWPERMPTQEPGT